MKFVINKYRFMDHETIVSAVGVADSEMEAIDKTEKLQDTNTFSKTNFGFEPVSDSQAAEILKSIEENKNHG